MSTTAESTDAVMVALEAMRRQLAGQIERLEKRVATAIPDPLLTRKDLARILSVSERTISTMIEDGRLPRGKTIGSANTSRRERDDKAQAPTGASDRCATPH